MTLREHLEAIRDRHLRFVDAIGLCGACDCWPCPDYEDAVAALAILDAAEREEIVSAETGDAFPTVFRLVRDPDAAS